MATMTARAFGQRRRQPARPGVALQHRLAGRELGHAEHGRGQHLRRGGLWGKATPGEKRNGRPPTVRTRYGSPMSDAAVRSGRTMATETGKSTASSGGSTSSVLQRGQQLVVVAQPQRQLAQVGQVYVQIGQRRL
jgi:hypothetical protein